MKISKALFAVVASSTIAGAAFGQEAVQAEKQAPIKQLLPGAYGSVEVRHTTLRQMKGDKQVDDAPTLSVRPVLGSTFFDGKLDTYFMLRYNFKPDSTRIAKSVTDNETFLTLAKNDLGAIKAYAYTVMAGEDSFTESALGFYNDIAKSYEIVGGSLRVSGYSNPTATYKSGTQAAADKVSAEDRAGFGLSEEDRKVEQQDPTIGHLFGTGVRYSPAAVKGLSFGPSLDLGQLWSPKYNLEETETGTKPVLDGYETRLSTMTRLVASYKVTDAVTLSSQIRHIARGFYAKGVHASDTEGEKALGYGKNRYEARVSLSTSLF